MLYTAKELAEKLGVSKETVRKLGVSGEIPRHKEGRRFMYEYGRIQGRQSDVGTVSIHSEGISGYTAEITGIDEVETNPLPKHTVTGRVPPGVLNPPAEPTIIMEMHIVDNPDVAGYQKSFIERVEDKVVSFGEGLAQVPSAAASMLVELGVAKREDMELIKILGTMTATTLLILFGIWATS